jgi:plasmid maintenance system antidote protein VapI
MNWLMQIAPTIATCLGTPLAGLAVTALAKLFGVSSDSVTDMIQNNKLTADQIAAVKLEEIKFKEQTQALGLNFEQLAVQDRASARDMQKTTQSLIPPLLSLLVTVGFFGILLYLMVKPADTANTPLMIMLGSLGTAWTGIIAFYFGSSAGSRAKDEMLFQSQPAK